MPDIAIDTPGEYLLLNYYLLQAEVRVSGYLITPEGQVLLGSRILKTIVDPADVGKDINQWSVVTRALRSLALRDGLAEEGWTACGESNLLFRPTTSGPQVCYLFCEEHPSLSRRASMFKDGELSRQLVAYQLTPFGRLPIEVSDIVAGRQAAQDERFAARLERQGWQRILGLPSFFQRPAEPRRGSASPAAPTARPSTCPGCGAAVSRGKFCGSCGRSLEPRSCRSCHAALDAGSRFCVQCGAAVMDAADPDRG